MVPGDVGRKTEPGFASRVERDVNRARRRSIIDRDTVGMDAMCQQGLLSLAAQFVSAYAADQICIGTQRRRMAGKIRRRPAKPRPIRKEVPQQLPKADNRKTVVHFSAPDFFASLSSRSAHGWRGNTTDKIPS